SGEKVPGRFEWAEQGIVPPSRPDESGGYSPAPLSEPEPEGVESVSFIPSEPRTLGADYQLLVPKGVASQKGTETAQDYSATFTVTPPLAVISSNPANGEEFADIWQGWDIIFPA